MQKPEFAARAKAMVEAREQGLTHREIAARHGISRGRTAQILYKEARKKEWEERREKWEKAREEREKVAPEPVPVEEPPEPVGIDEVEMSARTYNCLKNSNILTFEELARVTEAELLRTPNFGRKSFYELREIVRQLKLPPIGSECRPERKEDNP
jgi:DNA-directed RNA polymerase alpha subunit